MPHDWRTALSTPPLFVPDQTWEPYVYCRSDKSPVTVCGSAKAILVVPGSFADSVTDGYDSRRVEFPDKTHDKVASGKSVDGILGAASDPLGTTTAAALRSAAGEPLERKESERPCDSCGGSGLVECYACGHEDDCEDCGGTGKVVALDAPDPHYLDFGGSLVNAQMVAPLFARVPDGAVEFRVRDSGGGKQFHLVGDGWRIVIAAMVPDANPDGERVQLLLSPNAPVQPCPTSAAHS